MDHDREHAARIVIANGFRADEQVCGRGYGQELGQPLEHAKQRGLTQAAELGAELRHQQRSADKRSNADNEQPSPADPKQRKGAWGGFGLGRLIIHRG